MKFLKKIKKKLNFFSPKKDGIKQTEEEYYEQLFIKNPKWNKIEPNFEEVLRWDIINEFIKSVIPNEGEIKILDLGCGRGWLTNLLSKYGKTRGIEPVKSVVEYAKKIFPNIEFLIGTTSDLLTSPNFEKYDLIVSSEVIEHIEDDLKDGFISDINKLLNNNGFLILTTPRAEVQNEWNKYLGANQPIEAWISEHDLEQLVKKNSFKTIKSSRIALSPVQDAQKLDIYQLWLFQKI